MRIVRNPELKGIIGLVLVIVLIGGVLVISTGKLEEWFGITIGGGPRLFDKIVFVSERGGKAEVYAVNPDGSDRKQLTHGVSAMSAPFVSALGNRVVFVGAFKGGSQVFSVNGGGSGLERLTSATGPKEQPAYTPDGRSLSFISSGTVYLAALNGDNLERVLPTSEEMRIAMVARNALPAYQRYAWWSDGKRIAAVAKDEKFGDVLVYLPKVGGKAKRMPFSPNQPAEVAGISWAVDEPILAVAAKIDKKSVLVMFDADTQQMKLLAVIEKQEFGAPSVSPDGSAVACPVKSPDGKAPSGIVRIDTSSGSGQIIAKGDYESAAYSPDGDMLLAVKVDEESGKRDIVVIDLTTGETKQLTNDGASYGAVWSPASRK
jgi:Tol biopolymer transport system component